ncbi:hypothetical protein A1Q1_06333 [Trichosporon asahii var. asahii CBS 2479]|uniref:Uncharacterized protein n=1 Tax=Trichosporon asahii var. asahii (strain ATCC 90039 / CBS 2479 / JCM 2466 / KCTC 7840 / NBRC 103889/ NCYC 2677 / UAMH 7654) TaxID=1186058 RepID=J6FAJ7_TRIAS|nr:hypothetical protein A1Q1_06333 [Trichosporon asahii var. asahii CBS 2479]EJT52227.1 hypothetical protein A1Q1_06333 [Trichosporon asahii var. asahii CBS 2479]
MGIKQKVDHLFHFKTDVPPDELASKEDVMAEVYGARHQDRVDQAFGAEDSKRHNYETDASDAVPHDPRPLHRRQVVVIAFEGRKGQPLVSDFPIARRAVDMIKNMGLDAYQLDVTRKDAVNAVLSETARLHADVVVLAGRGDTDHLTLEEVAHNPGVNGPEEVKARAPLRRAMVTIGALGVPVRLSADAGDELGNALFYEALTGLSNDIPVSLLHSPSPQLVDPELQAQSIAIMAQESIMDPQDPVSRMNSSANLNASTTSMSEMY